MLCCVARYEADESSDEELVHEYTHVTMQLLDLMHVLFSRAMGVQTAWERETSELWDLAWCPVLQVSQLQCCSAAVTHPDCAGHGEVVLRHPAAGADPVPHSAAEEFVGARPSGAFYLTQFSLSHFPSNIVIACFVRFYLPFSGSLRSSEFCFPC